jgi:hypothetical protein
MGLSKKQIWIIGGLCFLFGFLIANSAIRSENHNSILGAFFGIGLMLFSMILFNIVRAKNIEDEAFNRVKNEVDRLGYLPDESMSIAEDAFRILKSGPGADFSGGLEGTLGQTIEAPLKSVKGANFTPSDLKAAIELALMGHRRRD